MSGNKGQEFKSLNMSKDPISAEPVVLSDAASTHVNILRIYSIHIIAFSHGLENLALINFDNPWGVPGLNILMLISGLLISYSIISNLKDKNYDFTKYYLRRFARIYPAYLMAFALMVFIAQLRSYNVLDHIIQLIVNLLLLNDTTLGYSYYGLNRQLWILPLFWWLYFILGWSILGLRTTKKKYLYIMGLVFFSFIILLIYLGFQPVKKINYTIIWSLGAIFMYMLNKLNFHIQKKCENNNKNIKNKGERLKRDVKYLSLLLSIVFLILTLIRGFRFNFRDSYEIVYNLYLACSILSFLMFSQYVRVRYPKKIKSILNFFASYSFSLFLIHIALYTLFLRPGDSIYNFILIYIITNLTAIGIAYLTEFRYTEIYRFLLKVFKLYKQPSKNNPQKTTSHSNIFNHKHI